MSSMLVHLPGAADALQHAEEDDDPRSQQAEGQGPPHRPRVVEALAVHYTKHLLTKEKTHRATSVKTIMAGDLSVAGDRSMAMSTTSDKCGVCKLYIFPFLSELLYRLWRRNVMATKAAYGQTIFQETRGLDISFY